MFQPQAGHLVIPNPARRPVVRQNANNALHVPDRTPALIDPNEHIPGHEWPFARGPLAVDMPDLGVGRQERLPLALLKLGADQVRAL